MSNKVKTQEMPHVTSQQKQSDNQGVLQSRMLADMIEQSGDKFFSCTFVKKNGEIRKMTARFVEKVQDKNNNQQYFTVYSPKTGYRSINKDTILSVSVKGLKASVKGHA
jgi:hypothetical protein